MNKGVRDRVRERVGERRCSCDMSQSDHESVLKFINRHLFLLTYNYHTFH